MDNQKSRQIMMYLSLPIGILAGLVIWEQWPNIVYHCFKVLLAGMLPCILFYLLALVWVGIGWILRYLWEQWREYRFWYGRKGR